MQIRSPAPLAVQLETMSGTRLVPVVTALDIRIRHPIRTGADPARRGQKVLPAGSAAPTLELEMPASLALVDLLLPSMGAEPTLTVRLGPSAGGPASRITGARLARLVLDLDETGPPRFVALFRGLVAVPETAADFGPADGSPRLTGGDLRLSLDGAAVTPLRRCRLTMEARLHAMTAPDQPAPVAWLGGRVELTLRLVPGVTSGTLASRLAQAGPVAATLELGRAGSGRRLALPPGLIGAGGFDGASLALEAMAAAPPTCTEF